MKIRDGFVSNSSSSSFTIFARPATINEIDDEKVKIELGYGSEGIYYSRPTEEMISWMKEHSDENYQLWYEYFSFSEEVRLDFNNGEALAVIAKMALEPPEREVSIKSFEKDYYFPDDLESFVSHIRNEY